MHSSIFIRNFTALGALIAVTGSAAAQPTDFSRSNFSNSATYNAGVGITPGGENRLTNLSTRDDNGNRIIVNGVMSRGNVSRQEDLERRAGNAGANTRAVATSIGNSLNVTVEGSWNTVIIDSTQINNGDQQANISLNGELNL